MGEHLIGDLLPSSLRLKTGRIAQGNLLPMSGQPRRIGLVEGEWAGDGEYSRQPDAWRSVRDLFFT
jgi:hypothetical protein